jgi:hypothetical protein
MDFFPYALSGVAIEKEVEFRECSVRIMRHKSLRWGRERENELCETVRED